jgi:hypothetical protein
VNEPFVHGLTLREEGQVELWEWPNELSAGVILQLPTNSVNSIFRRRPFQSPETQSGFRLFTQQAKTNRPLKLDLWT